MIVGYLYLTLATIIYGLYGFFSRKIAVFEPFSQTVVRYSIIVLVLGTLFIFKRLSWKNIVLKDIKWFALWSIPASIQPVLTYIAFTKLPVGLTYFLIYSTMILGGIISGSIFFTEKLNLNKISSVILILIGLGFIYYSDLSLITNIYVLIALIVGFSVGLWNTLTKKVSNKYSEYQMIFIDSFTVLVVCFLGFINSHEKLPSFSNISAWFWAVIFAFLVILASFLLIKGFAKVEAQTGSLILPMELIFSSIFGFLLLGETLKLNIYFGGFLILIAALLPSISHRKSTK